jgi:hypothetical protein
MTTKDTKPTEPITKPAPAPTPAKPFYPLGEGSEPVPPTPAK